MAYHAASLHGYYHMGSGGTVFHHRTPTQTENLYSTLILYKMASNQATQLALLILIQKNIQII